MAAVVELPGEMCQNCLRFVDGDHESRRTHGLALDANNAHARDEGDVGSLWNGIVGGEIDFVTRTWGGAGLGWLFVVVLDLVGWEKAADVE